MSELPPPTRLDELAAYQRRSSEEQIKKSNHHLEIELWALVRDAETKLRGSHPEDFREYLGDLARNAFNLGKKTH